MFLGPIEKGASDGQLTYSTAISSALRAAVSAKPPVKAPGKGKLKKRSKAQAADDSTPTPPTDDVNETTNKSKQKDWGLLEPVRGLLGPVADILEIVVTTQTVMGLLAILLIYSWFFRSTAVPGGLSSGQYHFSTSTAQRAAAYEEIWRTEESELWKWLEERVALDRVHSAVGSNTWRQTQDMHQQLGREGAGMKEREIDEAIRVTEERLAALKRAVKRERETGTLKSPKEEQT